jgi:hypothetical protein
MGGVDSNNTDAVAHACPATEEAATSGSAQTDDIDANGTLADGTASEVNTNATAPVAADIFLGLNNKLDGRRTYCISGSSDEDRLRRNGFVVVTFRDSLRSILEWMIDTTQSSTSTQDVRQQSNNQSNDDDTKLTNNTRNPSSLDATTRQPSLYRPASAPPPGAQGAIPGSGGPTFDSSLQNFRGHEVRYMIYLPSTTTPHFRLEWVISSVPAIFSICYGGN